MLTQEQILSKKRLRIPATDPEQVGVLRAVGDRLNPLQQLRYPVLPAQRQPGDREAFVPEDLAVRPVGPVDQAAQLCLNIALRLCPHVDLSGQRSYHPAYLEDQERVGMDAHLL